MKKIKILIADDHMIVRLGLAALFSHEKDMQVLGEAEDGLQAVDMAQKLHPDVIVMDLMMPGLDGVGATRKIKELSPDTRILILTSYSTSDGIAHALDADADGAVLKTSDDASMLTAIRTIAAGERFVSTEIQNLLAVDPPAKELSPRQKDVLDSMIRGLTNKNIAEQLGIGEGRVEAHINAIFSKINAANRAEAVAIALRKHLLKI
jgi:DNA-binding NarL/FixJ family response regulator